MQQISKELTPPVTTGMAVYRAINEVQAALAKDGIGKGKKNKEQGYQYRGIDDVYNSLSILLANAGLCIMPRIKSREQTLRQTRDNKPLFSVVVEADFDFIAAADGSKHTVTVWGEAMDMVDKATNKAMSAAYKYACLQTFCIPTEGDNDADGNTPAVAIPAARGSVFDSPEERETACRNVRDSFDRSKSVTELKDVWDLNAQRLGDMSGSSDADDLKGYEDIVRSYKANGARLKQTGADASTKRVKPATVDSMMAGTTGDDR